MKIRKQDILGNTTEEDDHVHTFEIDCVGNGIANESDGHTHEIGNFKMQFVDGHSHDLIIRTKTEKTKKERDPKELSDKDLAKAWLVTMAKYSVRRKGKGNNNDTLELIKLLQSCFSHGF